MSQRRILFLTPTVPWPADSGGRIRTQALITHAAREAQITLFCVAPPGGEGPPPATLTDACERIEVFPRTRPGLLSHFALSQLERFFHSAPMHTAVQRELSNGSHDLIHIDELSIARSVGSTSTTPVLLHHHKLDARLAHDLATRRLGVSFSEVAKITALERRCSRLHTHHAACSSSEVRYLEGRYSIRCALVPNGVDTQRFTPSDTLPKTDTILFLGTLSYEPNVHGLEWFVRKVMPLLAEDRPDLRLKIVGQDPAARVHALASDRVEVIGPVADPVPHLHAATCSIAPLFIGGGTRIKILESLAAGCPVVSTSVGAEALDLAPDSLSLADGSGAFRAAILSILDDPAAAHAKARTSSAAVRARYSWEASAAALLDAWESCCAKTPA